MDNQGKLLEMLQEIKEIAGSQQNKITKEEIKKYLGNQELSADKMQAVYHYLGENHIQVAGYDFVLAPEEEAKGSVQENNDKKKGNVVKESRSELNLKLYQEEIARFSNGLEGEEELILSFLQGEDSVKNQIIEKFLQNVVSLSKKYEKRNVPADEIIAEGNVGLMVAMQIIQENRSDFIQSDGTLDAEKFFGTLEMEVTHAMEQYIDEMTVSKDWEDAVLAKTNLLHEATKYMTEEMGRVPTIEELSEYTKISREEINDLTGLSEDAKRVVAEKRK